MISRETPETVYLLVHSSGAVGMVGSVFFEKRLIDELVPKLPGFSPVAYHLENSVSARSGVSPAALADKLVGGSAIEALREKLDAVFSVMHPNDLPDDSIDLAAEVRELLQKFADGANTETKLKLEIDRLRAEAVRLQGDLTRAREGRALEKGSLTSEVVDDRTRYGECPKCGSTSAGHFVTCPRYAVKTPEQVRFEYQVPPQLQKEVEKRQGDALTSFALDIVREAFRDSPEFKVDAIDWFSLGFKFRLLDKLRKTMERARLAVVREKEADERFAKAVVDLSLLGRTLGEASAQHERYKLHAEGRIAELTRKAVDGEHQIVTLIKELAPGWQQRVGANLFEHLRLALDGHRSLVAKVEKVRRDHGFQAPEAKLSWVLEVLGVQS